MKGLLCSFSINDNLIACGITMIKKNKKKTSCEKIGPTTHLFPCSAVQRFLNTTSISGISNARNATASKSRTISWVVIFLVGLGFTLYAIIDLGNEILDYPVTTSITLEHSHSVNYWFEWFIVLNNYIASKKWIIIDRMEKLNDITF